MGLVVIAFFMVSILGNAFFTVSAQNPAPQGIQNKGESYEAPPFNGWYNKPTSYSQLVSWYQALEILYPGYIEVFKANDLYNTGTITGGYDAYYVRFTNESLSFHKPEVLFLGSPHGDETVGTVGMYWFADWLMRYAFDPAYENPDRDWLQWLLDNREIYFEVSHNPYGLDHGPQRYDGNDWDLNREADHDGPGSPTGGIWGSVNGETLRRFVDNHTIRSGCDFHGGARMMLYPWAEPHSWVSGTSPISGWTYDAAPPDFYFFDANGLRVGSYMGNLGGDGLLDKTNTGTVNEIIWYSVYGGICPWAYGADVVRNPAEDQYVQDETFGNYPGTGILWYSPEMSNTKNPSQYTFGNDTTSGWGWEVRRFILHQTDIAQPYVRLLPGSTPNDSTIIAGENITFQWEVNGCLVVDHTQVQWGEDPDPINNSLYSTPDYDDHAGDYIGGTGWDNATDGDKGGVTYIENIILTEPGDYYFVVKAQVDQIYNETLAPSEYGTNHSYLRLVKERVNDSYYEEINGTDGLEIIQGQTWWYSPVIHVTVDPGIITHEFSLKKEWNLITIPMENNFTAESLGQAIPSCTVVTYFDAFTQNFTTHVVNTPHDNFVIEKGIGYFVYLTENQTFLPTGWPIQSFSVDIAKEWNLVGWPKEDSTTAESLGENISGTSVVSMFDAETQTFTTHVVGTPHDNFTVQRGMGLFIYTTENSIWQGEG